MLLYDITKRPTFDHVVRWVDELRAHADNSIVIMLIGNKVDLVDLRAVPAEDAVEFAEDQGLFFSETSAFSGDNVDSAFFRLLEEIYDTVCKKALECGNGNSNVADAITLKGSKIDGISGTDLEISEVKKSSACSCWFDHFLVNFVLYDFTPPCSYIILWLSLESGDRCHGKGGEFFLFLNLPRFEQYRTCLV